jgi:hypothetical protein
MIDTWVYTIAGFTAYQSKPINFGDFIDCDFLRLKDALLMVERRAGIRTKDLLKYKKLSTVARKIEDRSCAAGPVACIFSHEEYPVFLKVARSLGLFNSALYLVQGGQDEEDEDEFQLNT